MAELVHREVTQHATRAHVHLGHRERERLDVGRAVMVEDGELRVGARPNDQARQGHHPVGHGEAGDHDGRLDHEPVGDLDHDRRHGERGVELGVEISGVGHHLADRGLVAGLRHLEPPCRKHLVELVMHHLAVDEHDERGS